MRRTNIVRDKILEYYSGDPLRSQHLIKVEAFATLIAEKEQVDEDTATVISLLGYCHDIGIKLAEQKYGKSTGKLQEELGKIPSKQLVLDCGFDEIIANRVSYVTAHHHTYTKIDNIEYQILVEADFIVNILENKIDKKKALTIRNKIFKTKSGKTLLSQMYALN
jgi:HD superfamily phosphodiesterase